MKSLKMTFPSWITNENEHAERIAAEICHTNGHDWKMTGGKVCPYGEKEDCSEPVEQCQRCGLYSTDIYSIHPDCVDCPEKGGEK